MQVDKLKQLAWSWVQTHVEPGQEFRTVQIRKGLHLSSDKSRWRLSYVLKNLVDEGWLERTGPRLQGFRLAAKAIAVEPAVKLEPVKEQDPPEFNALLAYIIGFLYVDKLKYVETPVLLRAIAAYFEAPVKLLQTKTAWQQNYDWAMHRLKRRGWVVEWNKTRVEVSPALHVDLVPSNGYYAAAAWLEKWWKDYAVAEKEMKVTAGPSLLDQIDSRR